MKDIAILNLIWALGFIAVFAFLLCRKSYAAVVPPPQRDYRVRVVEAVLLAEARGEGPGGIERVAEVIRNRMATPGFPVEAINVVTSPHQFSCLNGTTPDVLLELRDSWTIPSETFNKAQRCAYQLVFPMSYGAAFGELPNNVRGANHYHAAGTQPKWAVGKKAVATYKNHIFYKL